MTFEWGSVRRRNVRKAARPFRVRQELESLEGRVLLSFADGNGAVVLNVTEQNSGAALVFTFDGPLNANPTNPVQSPTNIANYAVQVPSGNPEVITSSLATVPISAASYNSSTDQVTLTLGTPLAQGQAYRVFVNGIANTESTTAPGLIDANQQPIDGDYDDTPSGDFYALFSWTAAGTPLNFTDSQGDSVTLTITGPGQLNAWRELNGDFDAGDLTAQANLSGTSQAVQQLSISGGAAGSTTLSGSALFAPGSNGVIVIPPSIPGTFTNNLPSYFQATAPAMTPPTPVVATANNLPFTLEIEPVSMPNLPALQSEVTAVDQVSGSPYQGDWLLFGGRDNGLHTFANPNDNFPPQNQNEQIYVVNPTTGQVWSEAWSATNVLATYLPALYSTNQESFQNGNVLYTVGGYGAADMGGGNYANYTTYGTLTALNVDGMIKAVINQGNVTALSQIQQTPEPGFKVTGGALGMLNGLAYLVVGQDFEGEYNPGGTTGFTQTYNDEIQAFQINYNGSVPNSLSISDYQAQNDQVNLRRRDYNLGPVVLSNGQQALEIYGGVFTPGPGSIPTQQSGYREPILIKGIGDTQVLPYQQTFSQYDDANISLFDPSTGAMDTIFLGGISLYDVSFATGQLWLSLANVGGTLLDGLPFVNDVTTLVQGANGATQEYEMANQLPGLLGSEATFFAAPGLAQSADGVFNLADLLAQPTTLGYMYGGIVSTVGDTFAEATQTMATNSLFKIVLVPSVGQATNTTLVNSVYQVLTNQPASAVQEARMVQQLNAGVPASQVALKVINAPAHRALEVNFFFNEYLNAQPTAAQLQVYLKKCARGATDKQVIAQILSSPAFRLLAKGTGQPINSALVTALYADLLNRPPTTAELASGIAALKKGVRFPTLILKVLNSTEYLTDQVNNDYTIYMARVATPANVRQGVNALRHGSSEQFLAKLMGTRVYFLNHPGVPGQTTTAVPPADASEGKNPHSASPDLGRELGTRFWREHANGRRLVRWKSC